MYSAIILGWGLKLMGYAAFFTPEADSKDLNPLAGIKKPLQS